MPEEILSMREKKIVRWGQGYVVFITPEAKKFDWDDSTKVKITASEENGKEKVVVQESEE